MKKVLYLFLFFSLTHSALFAQGSDRRAEIEEDLEILSEQINGMFEEIGQAIGEAKYFIETEMDLEKLDEQGNMRIMGDTVDITIFHDFFTDNMESFPEPFRPSEEMLEGLRQSAEELPELLLRGKNFFNDEEFQEAFGDLFKEFKWDEIEPIAPTPRSENGEPLPQKPVKKKKKRKTTKI